MKKINVSYESGYVFSVYLVRYFKFRNNAYFIYTLQEKDNRNYIKLYVVKIMKELGNFVTQTVRRPDEWNRMKSIVKSILAELKKQRLTCIKDLDPAELDKIVIYDSKDFMMASDLVNLLTTTDSIHVDSHEDVIAEKNEIMSDLTEKVLESEEQVEQIEILELDDEITEEIEILEL